MCRKKADPSALVLRYPSMTKYQTELPEVSVRDGKQTGQEEMDMSGRYRFEAAAGHRQDESLVKVDFNRAKQIEKVRYGSQYIFYPTDRYTWLYIYYKDIVWAYRRQGDIFGKLGTTGGNMNLNNLMIVTRDKKRIGIPVEEMENVLKGLDIIHERNAFVDIGFTRQKELSYLGQIPRMS